MHPIDLRHGEPEQVDPGREPRQGDAGPAASEQRRTLSLIPGDPGIAERGELDGATSPRIGSREVWQRPIDSTRE